MTYNGDYGAPVKKGSFKRKAIVFLILVAAVVGAAAWYLNSIP